MRACTIGVLVVLLLASCGWISAQDQDESTNFKPTKKGCGCNQYNCGCCENFEWDTASINETICANATYLLSDYGVSVTLTFNGFAVINETVSARNPPPICAATEIEELLPVDVCLKIYDINYTKQSACFMIIGKIGIVRIPILHLGCASLSETLPIDVHWWRKLNMWRTHVNHNSVDEPFVTKT